MLDFLIFDKAYICGILQKREKRIKFCSEEFYDFFFMHDHFAELPVGVEALVMFTVGSIRGKGHAA